MKTKTKKTLTISSILFLHLLIALILWRDLNLDLSANTASKPKTPEVTVKGITFERMINGKMWKVTAPTTYKEGQTIIAKDISANVDAGIEHTEINAKSGSYNLSDQIFSFNEATLISQQGDNQYNISSSNVTFEINAKKWNFNGDVSASSDEVIITTDYAVLLENEQTCEMPRGGRIVWEEEEEEEP